MDGAITNTGISTCANFSQQCSHTAITKARKKLPNNLFFDINQKLHHRKDLQNHLYAIDGSKVKVHLGFKDLGFNTRTCDVPVRRPAKRPLAMLSALTGIQSDTIVNYTLTKHFNERKCVIPLLCGLTHKDTVLLDRGYYSKRLLLEFYKTQVHCVMRLKRDAFKAADLFYKSRKTSLKTHVLVNNTFIPIKLVKYKINDSIFMLCTTHLDKTRNQLKHMYKQRWRVELSFKRLKSYLHINKIFALSELLWRQEMQARILIDTLTRHLQLASSTTSKNTYKTFLRIVFTKVSDLKQCNDIFILKPLCQINRCLKVLKTCLLSMELKPVNPYLL